MSILPYYIDPCFSSPESSYCTDSPAPHAQRPFHAQSGMEIGQILYPGVSFQPALPGTVWPECDNSSWGPQLNNFSSWDPLLQQPLSSSSSLDPNCDPFSYMQSFGYDGSPDMEAYSPPSTIASDVEPSSTSNPAQSSTIHGLPFAPIVPSSTRETPLVHARLRVRKPSKDSPKAAVDDRKYTCDFCPVQMARLHDINRHMRIHTGVHPYSCIGCGETFRRTDARTRHWCKQPECFKIHSTKAPASKARRRIP